jgi:hypothetical protein
MEAALILVTGERNLNYLLSHCNTSERICFLRCRLYISQRDVPRKDDTCQSDVLHHLILNSKERTLTATPIFILTKYFFSIFVYTSQWVVPHTECGLEWPSEDGRAGACSSLLLRIRTFYPLKMRNYALKTSGADSPLTYRHIPK